MTTATTAAQVGQASSSRLSLSLSLSLSFFFFLLCCYCLQDDVDYDSSRPLLASPAELEEFADRVIFLSLSLSLFIPLRVYKHFLCIPSSYGGMMLLCKDQWFEESDNCAGKVKSLYLLVDKGCCC
jgi:hypothetical protein